MIRKQILSLMTVLLLVGLVILSPAQATVGKANGDVWSTTVTYNLYATDGYISMADGRPLYIYGFVGGREGQDLNFMNSIRHPTAPGGVTTLPGGAPAPTAGVTTAAEAALAGNAQFPAPIIYAGVNDVVEIRLKNLGVTNKKAPNDPHSIHLHGLDVDAANDGVPETSLGAVPSNSKLPGAGNVVVYMFKADVPGTYMYHCHQEASIHVAMGMYGAMVIYNQGEAGAAVGPGTGSGSLYGWQYDKDYVLLLSDADIRQNLAEENAKAFNNVLYQPQYWFINGLSFPNTIHAGVGFNWNNWILTHPGYDPFIVGSISAPSVSGTPGEKVLLRVINMGFQTHPMHMHGFHGKIIGSDARGWDFANPPGTPFGMGMEKNTLTIGSGETYDWLLDFGQQKIAAPSYAPNATDHASGDSLQGTYAPGTESRYTANGPVSNTDLAALPIPDPFTPGSNYIEGPVVTGAVAHTPMSGQFFPFHNHEDYKATNNGVYPGGMFTMLWTTP
jgi:manganese oxidase